VHDSKTHIEVESQTSILRLKQRVSFVERNSRKTIWWFATYTEKCFSHFIEKTSGQLARHDLCWETSLSSQMSFANAVVWYSDVVCHKVLSGFCSDNLMINQDDISCLIIFLSLALLRVLSQHTNSCYCV